MAHRHGVRHLLKPHHHDHAERSDSALESSREGMRTVGVSFAALLATAALQAVIVAVSGSVALLGDTLHNAADALSAVPLAAAFALVRRPASRRFTYGLGRTEDLAGLAVVALIAVSAALAAAQAAYRLFDPQPIGSPGLVAAAAVVGFAGNEAVARYRIRAGRRIGSAALVADGVHARTDGLTSLSVLAAALGSALGLPLADPIVGLLITVMICLALRDAAREVFARLLDGVDPELVHTAEHTLADTPGVRGVGAVRLRWTGHRLLGECDIRVAPTLTVKDAHAIAAEAEHRLLHALPRLSGATVHTDPDHDGDPHAVLTHHRERVSPCVR